MSGYYMDRDGNLVHTRSGDIIKGWKETNKFTGSGEYVDVEHKNSKPKKGKEKKKKWSKWKDITRDIVWTVLEFDTRGYWLIGTFEDTEIFYFNANGLHFNCGRKYVHGTKALLGWAEFELVEKDSEFFRILMRRGK